MHFKGARGHFSKMPSFRNKRKHSSFRYVTVVTLPETNSSHLKMDGWNTSFLLGWPIFRGYVSFREGKHVLGCFGNVLLMVRKSGKKQLIGSPSHD